MLSSLLLFLFVEPLLLFSFDQMREAEGLPVAFPPKVIEEKIGKMESTSLSLSLSLSLFFHCTDLSFFLFLAI